MFKAYLLRMADGGGAETDFQRLQRAEEDLRAELRASRLGLNPAHNLSREEPHARHDLR